MKSDSILDGSLWPRIGLDHAPTKNLELQTNPYRKGHILSQLLLYDRLVIPTSDFGILPILFNWFGTSTVRDMLDSDSFAFIRKRDILGYAGNGNGLVQFVVREGSAKKFDWWQEALFCENERSIELQIRNFSDNVSNYDLNELIDQTVSLTSNFELPNAEFMHRAPLRRPTRPHRDRASPSRRWRRHRSAVWGRPVESPVGRRHQR